MVLILITSVAIESIVHLGSHPAKSVRLQRGVKLDAAVRSSPSEPCPLSLQLVSLGLESPGTSSQVSVALPRQVLYVVLRVPGYTTLLRKIRVVLGYIASLSLLCDLFKIDLLKIDDLFGVLC